MDSVLKQTERTVQEMEENAVRFKACTISERADLAGLTDEWQQFQKTKLEVKEEFHNVDTLNTFMRNLAAPREEWDTLIALSEEEMHVAKVSHRQAKHMVEEEKKKILDLNATVFSVLSLFEKQLQILKEKLQVLQNLNIELKNLKDNMPSSEVLERDMDQKEVQTELMRSSAEIKNLQKEMLQIEHAMTECEMEITQVKEDVQQFLTYKNADEDAINANYLSRLQKRIADTESLTCIKLRYAGNSTLVVEIPSNLVLDQPAANSSVDNIVLKVTLSFKESSLHYPCLTDLKCNIDSLKVADLWQIDSNINLPELINTIKQRWRSHVPLLSEVNNLRTRFAVDWIQEKNIIRVIVGKAGSIVCSLQIPPGYPQQGEIVLTNIMGSADDQSVEDLVPPGPKTLENWMQFLENVFGKP